MSVRLDIPSNLQTFNNSAERGAWVQTPESVLVHLDDWPQFHRRVWEAVVQCCNGPVNARRRKKAAHFEKKLETIHGRRFSRENIQRAVADLEAWGFLVPVAGTRNAWTGRIYLIAGLDFPAPARGSYSQREPYQRRFRARRRAENSFSAIPQTEGRKYAPALELVPVTADPPREEPARLPIPGDRDTGAALPIPGDPDKARPISLARPTPQPPQRAQRKIRRQKRRTQGGGNFDNLVKAYKRLHEERRSPLTPRTLTRAIARARGAHPGLTSEQIAEKLIALAPECPTGMNCPILWAASTDWAGALAPRPKAREFQAPAPKTVKVTPEQLAKEREQLIALGLISDDATPEAPKPEPSTVDREEHEAAAERQRLMATMDRFERAEFIRAQLANF